MYTYFKLYYHINKDENVHRLAIREREREKEREKTKREKKRDMEGYMTCKWLPHQLNP